MRLEGPAPARPAVRPNVMRINDLGGAFEVLAGQAPETVAPQYIYTHTRI